MKHIQISLTVLLCLTTMGGDYVVFKSKLASNSLIFRAMSDTFLHGGIGFLSSLIFFSYNSGLTPHACLFNIMWCTFVSSAIDIDHVLMAKSFSFKDITSVPLRGLLHCTTLWLLLTLPLLAYSYAYRKNNIYVLTWMLILAFASHHIRDANRRGLWMYPFGNTPPINKPLYLFLIMATPNICAFIFLSTNSKVYKSTIVNYKWLD